MKPIPMATEISRTISNNKVIGVSSQPTATRAKRDLKWAERLNHDVWVGA
jgi:hypothetical protein